MGLEVLFWIAVLTWMAKRSTEDVAHALKGTPNPRYEAKKAKALAAGQPAPHQPRYGGKDWWADFTSDAMAANTHKRRAKAKAKAQPVDDMVDVAGIRPPAAAVIPDPPAAAPLKQMRPDPGPRPDGGSPVPHQVAEQAAANRLREARAVTTTTNVADRMSAEDAAQREQHGTCARCHDEPNLPGQTVGPACAHILDQLGQAAAAEWVRIDPNLTGGSRQVGRAVFDAVSANNTHGWTGAEIKNAVGHVKRRAENHPTNPSSPSGEQPTLATVIPMFPIMKESTMANAEVTGLPTAIAFAQGMANAHRAASTAGGEQYVASLRSFEVGDGPIATVASARELSAQAAAAWERAAAEIAKGNVVKEAYEAVPDAGNKRFVTGE